jgi:uncharacterized protein
MAETRTSVANRPAWVDLASPDVEASRQFYSALFGWDVQVSPDPQYGGYGIAHLGGEQVAGIGPKMSADQPTVWAVYIGTADAEALAGKVQAAGGTVLAPPFDVGDQGRMAVFQDPSGAVVSAWQPAAMGAFHSGRENTFGWAELNARGVESAVPFYEEVFGWTLKRSDSGEGGPPYIEFQQDGESVGGAMEMSAMVPAEVPNYWLVYFSVADVDGAFAKATAAGAHALVPPMDFPGGRFAIVQDPQGATFGLLRYPGGG